MECGRLLLYGTLRPPSVNTSFFGARSLSSPVPARYTFFLTREHNERKLLFKLAYINATAVSIISRGAEAPIKFRGAKWRDKNHTSERHQSHDICSSRTYQNPKPNNEIAGFNGRGETGNRERIVNKQQLGSPFARFLVLKQQSQIRE